MCCSPVSVKAYKIDEDELGKECSMHGRVHTLGDLDMDWRIKSIGLTQIVFMFNGLFRLRVGTSCRFL